MATKRKVFGRVLVYGFFVALIAGTVFCVRFPITTQILTMAYEMSAEAWIKHRSLGTSLPSSCDPAQSRLACFIQLQKFWLPDESTTHIGKMLILANVVLIQLKEKKAQSPLSDSTKLEFARFYLDAYEFEIEHPQSEVPEKFWHTWSEVEQLAMMRSGEIKLQKKMIITLTTGLQKFFDPAKREVAVENFSTGTVRGEEWKALEEKYRELKAMEPKIFAQQE